MLALLLAAATVPVRGGPLWFNEAGAKPAAAAAIGAMQRAAESGLAPADYDADALFPLMDAAAAVPDAIARADDALTRAFLRYLNDLRSGRVDPRAIEPHFRVASAPADFARRLPEAVETNGIEALVAAAEPAFPQYARLKRLLAEYRELERLPAVELPPPEGKTGKVAAGDFYPGVAALHAHLIRLGDMPADSSPPLDGRYGAPLAEGVRRFQFRHGLVPDAVLGRDTLAAIGEPLATRVRQIVLSLERLRWLPDFAAGPMIAINIPSFQLVAFRDAQAAERPALSMPVVVGKAVRNETPVFLGEMRHLEFSPYWNVPASILHKELLPVIARDPGYLAREDMEIVNMQRGRSLVAAGDEAGIAALRSGKARLRQRPGPKNALGGVKFVLPNTMDIYLHATPARALFARSRRDFSHGCIRVRDPEALAQFVLQGHPSWTREAIEAAMSSGVNRVVPLPAPIPVVVFYTTALVDAERRPRFLPDVYGHDRRLDAALRQARPRGSPAADAARVEVDEVGRGVVADAAGA